MDQNQFIYREASLKDKDQLKNLGIISYGQFSNILGTEHWATLNGFLNDDEKLLELLNISKCYVCVYESKIIGMAHIISSGNPWHFFKAEWSYIRMVGVDPKFGGRGIAKKLTAMCIEFAKQKKEKVIALHTSEFMDAARHIYESLGFEKVEELERRYGKRYWLYMLHL
jgi:ribosomal protein S18 acetylase RimI-like enzyme